MKAKLQSKLNLYDRVQLEEVIPLSTPFLLYIDPSSACNFKCEFCPTGHKELVRESEYRRGILDFDLFKKVIDGLREFDQPLKVLRMNKIGEPFVNKNLAQMIGYAKDSGLVKSIDLATNGALFTHENLIAVINAGLNRLNISLEGINADQYLQYAKVKIDFDAFYNNIKWLYDHKDSCEITIKIPGNYLNQEQRDSFYQMFGDYCDRIFIEDLAPIWPAFDIEKNTSVKIDLSTSQYQQKLVYKEVCSYIFYSLAINADGTVSACCPDWDQKIIVGDMKQQSLKQIWNSKQLNDLRKLHLLGQRCKNETCKVCGHIQHAQVDNIDSFKDKLLPYFE